VGLSELAAKTVDDVLVPLHRHRVAEMGVDPSGLFEHYNRHLDVGVLATDHVRRVAQIVVDALPAFESYHVIRAGLGELAFVLATMGIRTVAHEANVRRFGAMLAGHQALTAVAPDIARLVTLSSETMGDLPHGSCTLGIAYHLVGFPLAEDDRTLDTISRYRALLIEPRTFLRLRLTPREQAAGVDLVRRSGFTLTRDFLDAGVVYCARPD
jgi:hypothetical protein